jgi:methyl-accepting chemotaxis protein
MTASLSTSQLTSVNSDQARFLSRWLTVWVVLLTVVVLVVVFYLTFITNSLASINKNLGVASSAVSGAGGHVQTLPGQIQNVNASLTSIDTALKPITGQAGDIINALTSVDTSLQAVDGSLKDTSSSLVNTSSSLVNTSSILQSVLGSAGSISSTLVAANKPAGDCSNPCGANQTGVQNIWQRVAQINTPLASARGDTNNVGGTLVPNIDTQLKGICNGPVVNLVDSLPSLVTGVNGHKGC